MVYDKSFMKQEMETRGDREISRLVDDVQIFGREKLFSLTGAPSVFIFNHLSMLDYFIPMYAIMKAGFFPRPILGTNLKHNDIKNGMLDFEKWGAIWCGRKKSTAAHRNYFLDVKGTLANGISVLCFAEGKRNRNEFGEPEKFSEPFFRIILHAQSEAEDRDIFVVNAASAYEDIPERGRFARIDECGLQSEEYYRRDLQAFSDWMARERKSTARVNFGVPVSLSELAGEGSIRDKSIRVAERTREIVTELYREIKY